MKPVQVFGIVVRSFGLILAYSAFMTLWGVFNHWGFLRFLSALILFAVAFFLVRGAPLLVSLAYPKTYSEHGSE